MEKQIDLSHIKTVCKMTPNYIKSHILFQIIRKKNKLNDKSYLTTTNLLLDRE